jgi:hypothetical protein
VTSKKEFERLEAIDHAEQLGELLRKGQELDGEPNVLGGTLRSSLIGLRAEIDRALAG